MTLGSQYEKKIPVCARKGISKLMLKNEHGFMEFKLTSDHDRWNSSKNSSGNHSGNQRQKKLQHRDGAGEVCSVTSTVAENKPNI